jgi:hypothetical protein
LIEALQSLEMVKFIIENYYEEFKKLPDSPSKDEMLSVIEKEAIKVLKKKLGKEKAKVIRQVSSDSIADLEESLNILFEYHTRAVSIQLRELAGIDAYPIVTRPIPSDCATLFL